jgi:LmbE family N-acetylglucosaminyl deacetylase
MLRLQPQTTGQPLRRILCLGAHSDDIEIGCGGTLLKLIRTNRNLEISWVVFSAEGEREQEARRSASLFLKGAKKQNVLVRSFRNGYFPYVGSAIKDFFEELKAACQPDLIFTHFRRDLHQDHRVLCELTWNTYRDHFILEYEVPKYDGDLGVPNFFVQLDSVVSRRKVRNLMACFGSQHSKRWFTEDTFHALLRLRGVECQAPTGLAEAFYCRKAVCF